MLGFWEDKLINGSRDALDIVLASFLEPGLSSGLGFHLLQRHT